MSTGGYHGADIIDLIYLSKLHLFNGINVKRADCLYFHVYSCIF